MKTLRSRAARLFLLPAVALAVVGLASTSAQEPAPAPKPGGAVVPFEMLPSNHMVVNARFNGKEANYRMIFDLGSPVTLLASKAAEKFGAIPKDAPRSIFFGTRGEGKLDAVQLGDLKAEKIPVMVMDHPALKALGGLLGRPLDGILGYTFFAHYRLTIDYQARKMTFIPVDFEVKDYTKEMQKKMMGPKVARTIYLDPAGLWGLTVGEPEGGVSSRGVPIKAVVEGSPAAVAGLKVGDVLTTVDGRWTTSIPDVYAAAASVPAGQAVAAVVLRGEDEVTVNITPREGL